MNITIVGDGVFGTFLRKELAPFATITDDAYIVILAVPASAYKEVAKQHRGKHLVNVCSVQAETTAICLDESPLVTSIHPMFGPRSPKEGRTCILTHLPKYIKTRTEGGNAVVDLFANICDKIVTDFNGKPMTSKMHDEMMALTHLQVVRISDHILELVDNAKHIPDECLPTSFKRLKAMAEQFLDMPPGTKESILSNKY